MPLLGETSMKQFGMERKTITTVILPCGSVEEHGPHLPLCTDTRHVEEIARRAAQRVPVWVAPSLSYGLCRSTSQHPGTVGIRASTLDALIKDLVRSFYRQGLKQVIILSGHAGTTHMAVLVNAGEELIEELKELKIAVLSVLELGKKVWKDLQEIPGDSHAGEIETSVMLYLEPDLVRGFGEEEYPSFPNYILVRNKRYFWPGGVWGCPRAATKEKGRVLIERSVEALVELVLELNRWTEPL